MPRVAGFKRLQSLTASRRQDFLQSLGITIIFLWRLCCGTCPLTLRGVSQRKVQGRSTGTNVGGLNLAHGFTYDFSMFGVGWGEKVSLEHTFFFTGQIGRPSFLCAKAFTQHIEKMHKLEPGGRNK